MQNFFDILGLSTDYALDEKALEKAYFAAQRAHHPDMAIGKPEAERVTAFLKSQLVNEAYETLKTPLGRAEHLLALQGIHVNTDEQKNVPPALLMEVMELRERLEEAGQSGVELSAMLGELKEDAKKGEQAMADAFARADYETAATEATRYQYLTKAIEEAHMLIYRLKAMQA